MGIYKELQPLRVSPDWKITYNLFYEEDPTEENITIFSGSYMLLMHSDQRKRAIDLTWRPDEDINGEYVLQVLNIYEEYHPSIDKVRETYGYEAPFLVFKSRNRLEIVAKLEELMSDLSTYKDPRILISRGVIDKELEDLRIALEENGYSEELAQKICESNHSSLQGILLNKEKITKDILLFLKDNGAKKGIKNKATQILNSKKYR